ncbi:MAG: DUF975 family protein [Clostridia bacterium]|nr:DUF975 family protein [Clostridiales bacterium]MBQ6805649.1 DUF975 family protein [Clostridia bacterium]
MTYIMKTRQEIKAQAKEQLNLQRGLCIGIYLLAMAAMAILSACTLGLGTLMVAPVIMIATSGFFAAAYLGKFGTASQWFNSMLENFTRKLGGYLWMMLWIFLWMMLFYIPGFVKAISYSMTPYILAECPNVKAKDALRLSMRMTQGYKMDIFVTQLSFIGWLFLCALTCGVLQVVHVGPYMNLTMGGVYQELKKNAIENGVIRPEEFEGAPVVY